MCGNYFQENLFHVCYVVFASVDFSQGPRFCLERWCQNKWTAKMPFFPSGKLKINVRMHCLHCDFSLILLAFKLFHFVFSFLQFCCLHIASGYLSPCIKKSPKAGLQFDFQLLKRQTWDFVHGQRTKPLVCVGHHQKPVLHRLPNCLFSVLFLIFRMCDLYSYFPGQNTSVRA